MAPWSRLTWRGRGLLLLGVALVVVAVAGRQRDLLRLALALIALPGLALLLVRPSRLPLSVTRRLEPPQTPVGGEVVATLGLDRRRNLTGGIALFEEQVPTALGVSPRFCLHQRDGQHHREFRHVLHAGLRGRHRLGPLRVQLRDGLGLVQCESVLDDVAEVLVTPAVVDLAGLQPRADDNGRGDEALARLGVAGDDDILVREYRYGDDIRRVHWRSSAKTGELMVRREEQTWEPRAAILLDTRESSHAGVGPTASLEWAVSAAASVAVCWIEEGYRVEIVDAAGATLPADGRRETDLVKARALEFLTDVTLVPAATLDPMVAALRGLGRPQVVVLIGGRMSSSVASAVASVRPAHGAAMAMLLDAPSFADAPAPAGLGEARTALVGSGWQVTVVAAQTTITQAWDALRRSA